MTFIAIHASRHRADIATDTLSYAGCAQTLGHTTKLTTLHHLSAAVLSQGDFLFGTMAKAHVAVVAEDMPDFDALLDAAGDTLATLWDTFTEERDMSPATVYLVGYSSAAEAFTAWAFTSESGFAAQPLDGLHVHPSPTDTRPSQIELDRLAGMINADDLATLSARPEPSAPQGRAGWVALALRARQTRAMAPTWSGLKTFVGGDLYLTRLERGAVTTKRAHTFDDQGEEFRQMIAGTYHPQAQLGPCHCGTGKRYLDCCLVKHADEDCLCKSGKAFRDCCRVSVDEQATSQRA